MSGKEPTTPAGQTPTGDFFSFTPGEVYKPRPLTDDTGALIETGFVKRLVYADSLPL